MNTIKWKKRKRLYKVPIRNVKGMYNALTDREALKSPRTGNRWWRRISKTQRWISKSVYAPKRKRQNQNWGLDSLWTNFYIKYTKK